MNNLLKMPIFDLQEMAMVGAYFSDDNNYRFVLWRIWDKSKPLVMFIGLNPSTANDIKNDPTINKVAAISKNNNYGGFFMLNCFPMITSDFQKLIHFPIHFLINFFPIHFLINIALLKYQDLQKILFCLVMDNCIRH